MAYKSQVDKREALRRWRAANKQRVAEVRKMYTANNAASIRQKEAAWCATARGRFAQQRAQAHKRGIPWELTFDEWWAIWEASGKWEERGHSKGKYCMCRTNDVGPYRVGNVRIDTTESNKAERWDVSLGRSNAPVAPRDGGIVPETISPYTMTGEATASRVDITFVASSVPPS